MRAEVAEWVSQSSDQLDSMQVDEVLQKCGETIIEKTAAHWYTDATDIPRFKNREDAELKSLVGCVPPELTFKSSGPYFLEVGALNGDRSVHFFPNVNGTIDYVRKLGNESCRGTARLAEGDVFANLLRWVACGIQG